jgi:hypothetical protein
LCSIPLELIAFRSNHPRHRERQPGERYAFALRTDPEEGCIVWIASSLRQGECKHAGPRDDVSTRSKSALEPSSIKWNRHREGAKRRSDPDEADTALVWIASLPLAMTGWFDLKAIRSSA